MLLYAKLIGMQTATPAGSARAEAPGLNEVKVVTKNSFCEQKRNVESKVLS